MEDGKSSEARIMDRIVQGVKWLASSPLKDIMEEWENNDREASERLIETNLNLLVCFTLNGNIDFGKSLTTEEIVVLSRYVRKAPVVSLSFDIIGNKFTPEQEGEIFSNISESKTLIAIHSNFSSDFHNHIDEGEILSGNKTRASSYKAKFRRLISDSDKQSGISNEEVEDKLWHIPTILTVWEEESFKALEQNYSVSLKAQALEEFGYFVGEKKLELVEQLLSVLNVESLNVENCDVDNQLFFRMMQSGAFNRAKKDEIPAPDAADNYEQKQVPMANVNADNNNAVAAGQAQSEGSVATEGETPSGEEEETAPQGGRPIPRASKDDAPQAPMQDGYGIQ